MRGGLAAARRPGGCSSSLEARPGATGLGGRCGRARRPLLNALAPTRMHPPNSAVCRPVHGLPRGGLRVPGPPALPDGVDGGQHAARRPRAPRLVRAAPCRWRACVHGRLCMGVPLQPVLSAVAAAAAACPHTNCGPARILPPACLQDGAADVLPAHRRSGAGAQHTLLRDAGAGPRRGHAWGGVAAHALAGSFAYVGDCSAPAREQLSCLATRVLPPTASPHAADGATRRLPRWRPRWRWTTAPTPGQRWQPSSLCG